MSKITDLIFHNEEHYITSKYGKREPIKTQYGTTSNFHYGTDYGTNLKKIPQYAVEDGVVLSTGVSNSCGNYVWIKYDRLNVKMCHYHLDKICVKKGQTVNNDTLVGYTGTTGYSTGIHLHLGVYDLSKNCYIDPEEYAKAYNMPTEDIPDLTFKVGNRIVLSENATVYQGNDKGVKIPQNIKNKEYIIQEVSRDGQTLLLKEIFSWVLASECTLINELDYIKYKVVKGDTLWKIAQEYNTSVDEIVKLNNIENPDLIIIGQILKIPA